MQLQLYTYSVVHTYIKQVQYTYLQLDSLQTLLHESHRNTITLQYIISIMATIDQSKDEKLIITACLYKNSGVSLINGYCTVGTKHLVVPPWY